MQMRRLVLDIVFERCGGAAAAQSRDSEAAERRPTRRQAAPAVAGRSLTGTTRSSR